MARKPKVGAVSDFDAWVLEALELGFGCFGDGNRTPFILIDDEDGQRHLVDVTSADGTIDEALVRLARKTVRETFPMAVRYAIVWDGYLTTDDSKCDAVFAEAGARGDARATIFAQQYKQAQRSKTLRKVDAPIAVKRTTQLLKKPPKPGRRSR
jgi:hypothetical protein